MQRLVLIGFILAWEALARFFAWADYFIPAPSRILTQILADKSLLIADFWATTQTTLFALLLSFIFAFLLASLTHFSKTMSAMIRPLALILQVTPIIALAPLLLIYAKPSQATLIIAILIAFFPLYTGFLNGFKAVNAEQTHLFTLYKASKWQRFKWLELPTSMPFVLAGLEVSTGLALVGTIVGEFTAGAGNGLAIRLLESQYRLNIPRLYACLVLIVILGAGLRVLLTRLSLAGKRQSQ